jgi:hypothetical protein
MRRGRYIALGVVAAVAVLAALAWLNRPSDHATKATVDDAVRSFRDEDDRARRGDGDDEPLLGVYRYRTRGSETAQNLLAGGATHDYRGISTITLSDGRCGLRERWQVLAGRWSEGELCTLSQGDAHATATEFHEFFGVGQEDSFRCSGVPVGRAQLRPGAHFASSCRSDDSSLSSVTRVVGIEMVSVGGKKIEATHSMSRSRLEGGTSGTGRREEWRRRSDGLLLRRTVSSDAESSGSGGTDYNESYTLQLLAVTPRR